MKRQIPNCLTLLNLFSGCCAAIFIIAGIYDMFILAFFLCLAADFLDGLVARALGVSSPLGGELDSLADLISFGLVPSIIYFIILLELKSNQPIDWRLVEPAQLYWAFPAFILTAFSAYRLAKFNLDDRQTKGFLGLATPASALFSVGILYWWLEFDPKPQHDFMPLLVYAIIALQSIALIIELPLFAFKFERFDLKSNWNKFLFIAISLVLTPIFGIKVLVFLIILYLILSIIGNVINEKVSG